MSSDDNRTRRDPAPEDVPSDAGSPDTPAYEDLVSQVTPRSLPEEDEQAGDPHATRPSARPADMEETPPGDEETIVSGGGNASQADLDTDNFTPSEFGSDAKLDSQETTRFAPNIAAQKAVREFRKTKKSHWTQIGRFEVIRELGSGAFGKVFLAQDKQLDRPVAVKVAKAGAIHTEEDKERFLREARAAASLRHPHIVPVYEYGEHEATNYIAYQFIAGTTLRHVLRQKPKMATNDAVSLVIKVASALDYAHQNHIVHRDVKPENILIDEANQPHVADFGCARQGDNNVLLTLEGAVMGTPAYMSPEQASGESHRADGRADVWSLGVILSELLTGERPFKGNITEILMNIRTAEPRSIRQVDRSLPKDLETIVQRCLAKDPKDRLQTAGELVDELERWERGEPIMSRPINLFARTWRWAKRNPQVAALLSAVVATFALLAIVSFLGRHFVVEAKKVATAEAVSKLPDVESQVVNATIENLDESVVDEVRRRWEAEPKDTRNRARYGLALMTLGAGESRDEILAELKNALLTQPQPEEVRALRDGLIHEGEWFVGGDGDLWEIADDANGLESERVRAYATLALFDPDSDRWQRSAGDVVEMALSDKHSGTWFAALRPVREFLRDELRQQFVSRDDAQGRPAEAIAQLYDEDQDLLTELTGIASPTQLGALINSLDQGALVSIDGILANWSLPAPSSDEAYVERVHQAAVSKANLLIAKFLLGRQDDLLKELSNDARPDVRTEIIERMALSGIDPQVMKTAIQELANGESDAPLMSMLLGFGKFKMLETQREAMKDDLLAIYARHPDAAVHSAAAWLLGSWGFADELAAAAARGFDVANPNWRVLPTGQTLVALGPVDEFEMGSTQVEQERFRVTRSENETRHRRRISRRFEVATHEVTAGEFAEFVTDFIQQLKTERQAAPADDSRAEVLDAAIGAQESFLATVQAQDPTHPVDQVSWFDAISYCRWISDQNGVPESEQCYQPLVEIATREMFSTPQADPQIVTKKGFRLPTVGEWEYACRAFAETAWPIGDANEHLPAYAWIGQPQGTLPLVPGTLKPNRFGLHDMLGNVSEWCLLWAEYPPADALVSDPFWEGDYTAREYRGGNLHTVADRARPARREEGQIADSVMLGNGFRIVRTIEVFESP